MDFLLICWIMVIGFLLFIMMFVGSIVMVVVNWMFNIYGGMMVIVVYGIVNWIVLFVIMLINGVI